ncbi:MAG: two-component system response regulator [Rhizobiales bacterium NRL2]|jgi:two-component system chemotaxis response regulator CheY|nr:MAG: two-component system response regulator [Rhizobiales bacterium NRL2]
MRIDQNMPILIVDDYLQMLRIIGNLLRQIGFTNIDTAMDGAAALRKLRENDYGLIISDWNMEPITGYQLLEEIRADEELHDLPFIMVTAESKTEHVIAAKQAGVNNYIVKPFTAQTLREKMELVFSDY